MEYRALYESPLGGITMTCDGSALTELRFDKQEETPAQDMMPEAAAVFAETVRWLDLFFAGKDPGFTPPLAPQGTAFRRQFPLTPVSPGSVLRQTGRTVLPLPSVLLFPSGRCSR